MNGDDLFGHLSKSSSKSNAKKRTLNNVLSETSQAVKNEDSDSKRRKIETTATTTSKAIIHRHQLKGGAGTQSKNCVHEVALPPNSTLIQDDLLKATSEQPLKMAKKYKFELDPFQKHSVACIEQEQSVLVAAHTSAGKTAVAEYAVAKSLKGGQRVIYTSPIKALSNQKYRDLVEGFQDVGLMTGDVTINPNASCLVMTTEILRSMLYRGSEVMREVAWVIFDEVHYMRDRDRGVVWEESIIMLPHKVKFVFLSATIPNAFEFAAWVAKVHDQPCHVVYTEYRPTPLEHYIFPSGGEGLHLVVDGDGKFREKSFQKAVSTLASTNLEQQLKDQAKSKSRRKQKKQAGDDLYRIIKMIMKREYNPVIVFSFSKKDCETNALALSKLNMNSTDESELVEKVFKSALESLSEEDRKLPQIQAILPLLKRGIGIHHGGLLPILKEVIEILFGEGLLKCLFATETFAMGVNMPAKTVVFTSARKFDGKEFRFINSNEYVQMSGRAGRRNVDTRGIVIQMLDEKMEQTQIKRILKGFGDPLQSSFHLGYNMLLNLLRVEDSDPEYMMRYSLHQFQKEIQVPKLESEVENLRKEHANIKFPVNTESQTEDYCRMLDQIQEQKKTMRNISSMPEFATPFLQVGRLIRVVENEEDWGLGVVISFCQASEHAVVKAKDRNRTSTIMEVLGAETGQNLNDESTFIVDIALRCQRLQGATSMTLMTRPRPCNDDNGEVRIVPVLLSCVRDMSAIRINVPKDLTRREKLQSMWKSVKEVKRRFPDLPKLDPEDDMGIDDTTEHGKRFLKAKRRVASLQERVCKNVIFNSDKRDELVELFHRRRHLERAIATHQQDLKSVQKLALRETLLQMKRVLRRLGHISNDDILTLKARVACEINAADELLVTELLFEEYHENLRSSTLEHQRSNTGTFNDLHPNVAVAILAAFADTARVKDDADAERDALPQELQGPFRALQDAARRVAKTQEDCGIEIDPEEYAKSFNAENVKIAYLWCNKDMTFAKIMKETSQFEGSIVRMIRRLEELAREVAASCAALGNQTLQKKFETGITNIKRDIVFAASLYL